MPKKETYYAGKGNTNAGVTTQINKNKILEAMKDEYGAIQHSCDRASVCIATYRNYYNNDEEFRAKLMLLEQLLEKRLQIVLYAKQLRRMTHCLRYFS
jgi:ribosomal protein S4